MEITALPAQRRELKGWENLILLPYHLTLFLAPSSG